MRAFVSKRFGSPSRLGRSRDWLKMKNPNAPAVSGSRGGLGVNGGESDRGPSVASSRSHVRSGGSRKGKAILEGVEVVRTTGGIGL
jgi:hypothetical protein